jgi:MoxR-like ATPase
MLSNADSQPLTAFQEFRDQLMRDFQVVGASDAFQSVLEQIFVVAPHNVTILLIGETGTGKELIARTIHALGSSSSRPFVPVDCAAIPESLFARRTANAARMITLRCQRTKRLCKKGIPTQLFEIHDPHPTCYAVAATQGDSPCAA